VACPIVATARTIGIPENAVVMRLRILLLASFSTPSPIRKPFVF